MKISISFILLILLASSCRKKDISVPFDELQGDYEWYYSLKNVGDSYAADASEDKYGIRITKNGRLQVFKNGDLVKKYRIIRTVEINTGEIKINVDGDEKDQNGEQISFKVKGKELTTYTYPFFAYRNNFSKKI